MFITVNYLAVLVAAIASFVVGGLWYSPVMFINQWMKLTGMDKKNKEEMKKEAGPAMGMMFVALLVSSFVIAQILGQLGTSSVGGAIITAFTLWLGFTAATNASSVFFEKRPLGIFLINAGYYLVSSVIMAIILVLWK